MMTCINQISVDPGIQHDATEKSRHHYFSFGKYQHFGIFRNRILTILDLVLHCVLLITMLNIEKNASTTSELSIITLEMIIFKVCRMYRSEKDVFLIKI